MLKGLKCFLQCSFHLICQILMRVINLERIPTLGSKNWNQDEETQKVPKGLKHFPQCSFHIIYQTLMSFKKYNNVQGGQSRVISLAVNSSDSSNTCSTPCNLQNGAQMS
uniref:Uncharacterized protein n=1 Tax=Rhizophora mucronata TaxID=61149 RepID=A0A2P2KR89_RHIMU